MEPGRSCCKKTTKCIARQNQPLETTTNKTERGKTSEAMDRVTWKESGKAYNEQWTEEDREEIDKSSSVRERKKDRKNFELAQRKAKL